jgi:IS5 family transposase
MKQQTLAMAADQEAGFERYRRPTKRDVFLATMEEVVPWQELCAVIEPHYPKAGCCTATSDASTSAKRH